MRGRPAQIAAALMLCVLLAAAGIPTARAVLVVLAPSAGRSLTNGGPGQLVAFQAEDGVPLHGRLLLRSRTAPTVVLIAGFRTSGRSMEPYARLMTRAGYNALLIDTRGIGASGGRFSLGAREPLDVEGAVRFLERRKDLPVHRYALLGVSLGAGVAIEAAAHLRAVGAVVADSPWADQRVLEDRMDRLSLHGHTVPLLPLAPWIFEHLLGVTFHQTPLSAIGTIPPRGILLIHGVHDANPTTTLADARALRRASGNRALLWLPPRGGHGAALAAQPRQYCLHVVAFLAHYLGRQNTLPQVCSAP